MLGLTEIPIYNSLVPSHLKAIKNTLNTSSKQKKFKDFSLQTTPKFRKKEGTEKFAISKVKNSFRQGIADKLIC